MPGSPQLLFLPGFAARVRAYAAGLPPGWASLQPPPARSASGSLELLRRWLIDEIGSRPTPVVLAGHSMGGALAILAAAAAPQRVSGLVLIGPAGLPLAKPVRASLADLARQLVRGTHGLADVVASLADVARAPRASCRLVRALRRLDLSGEMRAIRAAGIPVTVVGCPTDTLVPPAQAKRMAVLLGATYTELEAAEGHVWPIARAELLAAQLGQRPR
jgi:pimeloyl-ACP methyl ester carboxylesterase